MSSLFNLFIFKPIFNLLMVIYSIVPGGDFGIAIIIFTIIIRLLLWPLVKKQLHQTKKMRQMQPELIKIKKECAGNKQLEYMRMMELYKKHEVSTFKSFGVILIQFPIFIALFSVIKVFTDNRTKLAEHTYDFIENIGSIKQLIDNPDIFNQNFLGFIDLTKYSISSNPFRIEIFIFILVIVSVITQYIMSKQTSPSQKPEKTIKEILAQAANGVEASQSEMNAAMTYSMMKFLPFMMFFVMINLPGALALYYTMSNIVAVIQQKSILETDAKEMVAIADEPSKSESKKTAVKARLKNAQEANIIRIKAKDNTPKKKGK